MIYVYHFIISDNEATIRSYVSSIFILTSSSYLSLCFSFDSRILLFSASSFSFSRYSFICFSSNLLFSRRSFFYFFSWSNSSWVEEIIFFNLSSSSWKLFFSSFKYDDSASPFSDILLSSCEQSLSELPNFPSSYYTFCLSLFSLTYCSSFMFIAYFSNS